MASIPDRFSYGLARRIAKEHGLEEGSNDWDYFMVFVRFLDAGELEFLSPIVDCCVREGDRAAPEALLAYGQERVAEREAA